MGALQWFLLFCSFIFILLIPILYFYMYRFFVAPLEGLKATMEEIAEGDLNAYAEENSDVEELRLMATTFNHMMDQIQKLKIDSDPPPLFSELPEEFLCAGGAEGIPLHSGTDAGAVFLPQKSDYL